MVSQYVLVNWNEKTEFEKETQLPYGYQTSHIFANINDAVDWAKRNLGSREYNDYMIVEIENGFEGVHSLPYGKK